MYVCVYMYMYIYIYIYIYHKSSRSGRISRAGKPSLTQTITTINNQLITTKQIKQANIRPSFTHFGSPSCLLDIWPQSNEYQWTALFLGGVDEFSARGRPFPIFQVFHHSWILMYVWNLFASLTSLVWSRTSIFFGQTYHFRTHISTYN